MKFLLLLLLCVGIASAVTLNCKVESSKFYAAQNEPLVTCVAYDLIVTKKDTEIDDVNDSANFSALYVSDQVTHSMPGNLAQLLPSLVTLVVQRSKLQTIAASDLEGMQQLVELSLWRNMLEVIPRDTFDGLVQLQKLNLGGNSITLLDVETFGALRELVEVHLDHNELSELHSELFKANTKLQVISLQSNKLKQLPASVFYDLKELTTITLDHNDLEQLQDQLFDENSKLRHLSVQNNQLNVIGSRNIERFTALNNHNFRLNPCTRNLHKGYDLEELKEVITESCSPNCTKVKDWLYDEVLHVKRRRRAAEDKLAVNEAEIVKARKDIKVNLERIDKVESNLTAFINKTCTAIEEKLLNEIISETKLNSTKKEIVDDIKEADLKFNYTALAADIKDDVATKLNETRIQLQTDIVKDLKGELDAIANVTAAIAELKTLIEGIKVTVDATKVEVDILKAKSADELEESFKAFKNDMTESIKDEENDKFQAEVDKYQATIRKAFRDRSEKFLTELKTINEIDGMLKDEKKAEGQAKKRTFKTKLQEDFKALPMTHSQGDALTKKLIEIEGKINNSSSVTTGSK